MQYDILGNKITHDIYGKPLKKEKIRDSRRSFSSTQKKEIWAQQNGKCGECHENLDIRTVEYDHVKPWADKGRTITENGSALCPQCHKLKSHKEMHKKINKKRINEGRDSKPSNSWVNPLTGKKEKINLWRI